MRRTKTGEDLLKDGMPPGWQFADRGGMSRTALCTTGVFNDAGLATNPKTGAKIAIVLFMKARRWRSTNAHGVRARLEAVGLCRGV